MSGTIYKGTNVANSIHPNLRVKRTRVYEHVSFITGEPNRDQWPGFNNVNYFDAPSESHGDGCVTGSQFFIEMIGEIARNGAGKSDFQDVLETAASVASLEHSDELGRRGAAIGFIESLCQLVCKACTPEFVAQFATEQLKSHEDSLLDDLELMRARNADLLDTLPTIMKGAH